MLNPEQKKMISIVYNNFLASEVNGWDKIDYALESLDWLDDKQIFLESDALFYHHKNKRIGCPLPHPIDEFCPVMNIMESVEAILDLYRTTEDLHPVNRYILSYYLALTNMGFILELK